MAGLEYLVGKDGSHLHWWQVTRDERFFCAHLYRKILEAENGVAKFVEHINATCGSTLPQDANWELGYEVCFYRDLWWHYEKSFDRYSPKRTFDLCLFSNEMIVVIEAKAFEGFNEPQLESFENDLDEIKKIPRFEKVEVVMLGLSSSRVKLTPAVFKGKILSWKGLSESYGDDPVLQRADNLYGGYTGAELLVMAEKGMEFLVGCKGGINSVVKKGAWLERSFQTNMSTDQPPNRNWFFLSKFAETVRNLVPKEAL